MSVTTFLNGRVVLHAGDCLAAMATMPENSVDSIVSDPPYHLSSIVERFGAQDSAPCKPGTDGAYARASAGFMGKIWDGGDIAFRPETWKAVLRVLKPGGYMLAFSSSRTFGRMSVAMEDAGFLTHPLIGELFRSDRDVATFAESLTATQLDAFMRIMDRNDPVASMLAFIFGSGFPKATRLKACALDGPFAGIDVDGYRYGGQALKPALEPIYMGQKPFSEATGTANVLRWGAGALNIDGCRVDGEQGRPLVVSDRRSGNQVYGDGLQGSKSVRGGTDLGRWPANLIHDGSDEVIAAFPETISGSIAAGTRDGGKDAGTLGAFSGRSMPGIVGSHGSAARFFYNPKADSDDRIGSKHPTVKPVDLMRYLVRLVTPPGGTVLDPFAGTRTTGEAAYREGFSAVLIEREEEYRADIARRMALVLAGPDERRHAIIKAKGKPVDLTGTLFADPTLMAAE